MLARQLHHRLGKGHRHVASWKAERRSAWSPALPHPFDRRVGHARLREVMGQGFRLGGGGIGKAVAQDFRDAAMQDLAAALIDR
jgi:hypothetical protein